MIEKKLKLTLEYFALSYLLSWIIWLPLALSSRKIIDFEIPKSLSIVATYGPGFSAMILAYAQNGRDGLERLVKGYMKWKVPLKCYIFALFVTLPATLGSIAVYAAMGGVLPKSELKISFLIPAVLFYFFIFNLMVIGEEIGWRGFALPILQEKYGSTVASILIGLAWGSLALLIIHYRGHAT